MTHYADGLITETCEVVENVQIADATYRLRFRSPELAKRMLPGQFVMVRLSGQNDPLIGRALAMFDRFHDEEGQLAGLDVVYVVKGKFTQTLHQRSSGHVDVWGPLGNAFSTEPIDHLILVAGGVGQTPMLTVAKSALGIESFGGLENSRYAEKVTLCYGSRSAGLLAGLPEFRSTGIDLKITTDDGSAGERGLVTDSLRRLLDARSPNESVRVLCCGPEPMMEAVAKLTGQYDVACQVSLETPMACGIGICFTCVAKVKPCGEDDWDYRRTCVDGPIFDAREIVWN